MPNASRSTSTTGPWYGQVLTFNLASAAIAYPAGALSDRWPRSRVYALGLACFAVGYVGLGLVDGGWAVVALLVVYGGFAGITDGVGKAWISALAPPDVRGHAQGLFQGLTGAGILVDGYIRDWPKVREIGVPLWTRGATPNYASQTSQFPWAYNVPIALNRVLAQQGAAVQVGAHGGRQK